MELADALGRLSDGDLTTLLVLRPDLRYHASTLRELATHAEDPRSIAQCLARLDGFGQQLAHLLCIAPIPCTRADVLALVPQFDLTEKDVDDGIGRLTAVAMAMRDGDSIIANRGLRAAIPAPCGLGRPFERLAHSATVDELYGVANHWGLSYPKKVAKKTLIHDITCKLADEPSVRGQLGSAPDGTADMLSGLVTDPRTPALHYMSVDQRGRAAVETPLTWMVERGMLMRPDRWGSYAEMPREIGLAIRQNRLFAAMSPRQPGLQTRVPRSKSRHDQATTASMCAARAVNAVETTLVEWGRKPPQPLQNGGLRKQDLRAVSKLIDFDEADSARLLEIAEAAGLLCLDDRGYVPTMGFDVWLTQPLAERWIILIEAWLAAPKPFTSTGLRDHRDRVIPVLARHAATEVFCEQRDALMAALSSASAGEVVERESLARHLTWSKPAIWKGDWLGTTLAEARLLGLCGECDLVDPGRTLVASGRADAVTAAAKWLPEATTKLTLQADLTAIVDGIGDPAVAQTLLGFADVESRGTATVYRFSPGTIRRAFDAGQTAADVMSFLTDHAPRGVPQPLRYLIDDVARGYGRLRVGQAAAYISSDDAVMLAEIAASKRLAKLNPRAIAPGVLATSATADVAIEALRSAGYLPADDRGVSADTKIRAKVAGEPGRHLRGTRIDGREDALACVKRLRGALSDSRLLPLQGRRNGSHDVSLRLSLGDDDVDPTLFVDVLERSLDEDIPVEIKYRTTQGSRVRQFIVYDMDEDSVYDDQDRAYQLNRILDVRLLELGARL